MSSLFGLLLLAGLLCAQGYYVPGTYPQEFKKGAQLQGKLLNIGELSFLQLLTIMTDLIDGCLGSHCSERQLANLV